MGNRAFIYCRISEDREGAGLGVGRQREDCEALARERGYSVVHVFDRDNDISAYSGKTRPDYRAMLARLSEVDAVIVWHTDRLHRSPLELEEYIASVEHHAVTTLTVKAGELDLATPHGRLVARQLGSIARYESEHKAERIARKMQDKAMKGEWTGGTRPFGWDAVPSNDSGRGSNASQLVVNESEAELVRDACSRVLDGQSLGSIIKAWNERGVTTTMGKPWGYAQLRQVLLRARNAGIATFKGQEVGRLTAPAIVDEATYRAVVRELTKPDRRKSRTNRAAYLLSGIARCHCGELVKKLTATSGDWVYPVYRCMAGGGGHVAKRLGPVDYMARDAARHVLTRGSLTRGVAPELHTKKADLEQRLRDLEAREDELAEAMVSADYAAGTLAKVAAKLGAERTKTVEELADTEAQIRRVEDRADDPLGAWAIATGKALEAWDDMDLDAQREWIRHNLKITLLPANPGRRRTFDPTTVRIELWDGTPVPLDYPRVHGEELLPQDDPRGTGALDHFMTWGRRVKPTRTQPA